MDTDIHHKKKKKEWDGPSLAKEISFCGVYILSKFQLQSYHLKDPFIFPEVTTLS